MTGQSQRRVRFHIPAATHQALHAIAAARGETLAQTIRRAVDRFVEDAKGKPHRPQELPPTDVAA